MRRIYESEALRRDDEDPFSPNESEEGTDSHVNWGNLSHALVPTRLRPFAIDVDIETQRDRYAVDEPVPFRVTFRNRLPFPISIVTETPLRWTWAVDGHVESSAVHEPPAAEKTRFQFDRSERKRFHRTWSQRIQESATEWRVVDPGEHTLSVSIGAVHGAERLTAETTVTVER